VDCPGALATSVLAADQVLIGPQAGEVGDAQRHEQPQLGRNRRLDRQCFGDPAAVLAQDLANLKRRERQQAVANGGIVELAQARQVLLGHAVALLRHLLVEPLDFPSVVIRQHDAVLGDSAQAVDDPGDVAVGLAAVAVEEEGQRLAHMRGLHEVGEVDDVLHIVPHAHQRRGGAAQMVLLGGDRARRQRLHPAVVGEEIAVLDRGWWPAPISGCSQAAAARPSMSLPCASRSPARFGKLRGSSCIHICSGISPGSCC
jgi:hypothetical protein